MRDALTGHCRDFSPAAAPRPAKFFTRLTINSPEVSIGGQVATLEGEGRKLRGADWKYVHRGKTAAAK